MKIKDLIENLHTTLLDTIEKREKEKISKKYIYLILFFIALFNIDFGFRNTYIQDSIVSLYDIIPLLFTLFWCCVFTYIAFLLKKRKKKIYMIIISLIFIVYYLIQSAYFNLFSKYFTILDISLLREGGQFVDASYIYINESIIISFIISFILIVVSVLLVPEEEEHNIILNMFVFIICICLYSGARASLPPKESFGTWNANTNMHNIYDEYTDTTKALLLSGSYEYAVRDLFKAINPITNWNKKETIKRLDNYYSSVDEKHSDNKMTSLLKNKNVIIIQLENIDEWMLTSDNMPNMYKLRQESINFINHFATTFATGKTFNTEFIVNTGMIPPTNKAAPSYIYSKNEYPFSIANLFKKNGYEVNSFHASNASVYNRGEIHETFGYQKYHNYSMMGMEDSTMDSQLINGYDLMINDRPFMDFIITISAHGPFTKEVTACSKHIEEVQNYALLDDETYQCGLAQAKETDIFIGELINRLENDGLLDDTAIIMYTDHYAYGTISKEIEYSLKGTNDPNLLSNVPFFIWANDIEPMRVTKVTSSIDVLPTIANLMGFDVDYKYFIGNDVFSIDTSYAFFQDGSVYNGKDYYIPNDKDDEVGEEMKADIVEANERLNRSWDMLTTDYFNQLK